MTARSLREYCELRVYEIILVYIKNSILGGHYIERALSMHNASIVAVSWHTLGIVAVIVATV